MLVSKIFNDLLMFLSFIAVFILFSKSQRKVIQEKLVAGEFLFFIIFLTSIILFQSLSTLLNLYLGLKIYLFFLVFFLILLELAFAYKEKGLKNIIFKKNIILFLKSIFGFFLYFQIESMSLQNSFFENAIEVLLLSVIFLPLFSLLKFNLSFREECEKSVSYYKVLSSYFIIGISLNFLISEYFYSLKDYFLFLALIFILFQAWNFLRNYLIELDQKFLLGIVERFTFIFFFLILGMTCLGRVNGYI